MENNKKFFDTWYGKMTVCTGCIIACMVVRTGCSILLSKFCPNISAEQIDKILNFDSRNFLSEQTS